MGTERLLVVFGSAVYCDMPRDVDIVCEGDFGDDERALVAAWARSRELPSNLPLDVKTARVWRGSDGRRVAELTLPTPHKDHLDQFVLLRGQAQIGWHRSTTLPARIRASRNVSELLHVLRNPHDTTDGRMAVLFDTERANDVRTDWDSYVQGRLALRNAIAKCSFWEAAVLSDDRVRFIEHLATFGVAREIEREIYGAGACGGAGGGDSWVSLEGVQPTHGRLIPWGEVLPIGRIRRRMSRTRPRSEAMRGIAPLV